MVADTGRAAPRRTYPKSFPHWATSLAAAGVAVAATTSVAQATGRFHWWAGFVLIPGALIGAVGGALLARGGGRAFAGYVVGCVGLLVCTVGALLMTGTTGRGWPALVVLPCLAVAGTYLWRPGDPLARGLHRTVALLALAGTGVGATLMLIRNRVVDPGETHWWGGFVLLAGVIIGGNAAELARHRMPYRLQAVTLLLGPAVVAALLGVRMLRGW
ncbi:MULTISPECIES: hypothetical protein [unclassified Micromonospora]|uniref:hypothetical protein n=1 Tax=unclassified Micromonospora TaxID=2617518 RepID=UPI003644953E